MTRKLLFFANDAPFLVSHRLPIIRAAVTDGYEVHIAAPKDETSEQKFKELGAIFHPLRMTRKGMNPMCELVVFLRVLYVFFCLRPDIAHMVTIKPVLYGGIAARILCIPACVFAISGMGYIFIREGLHRRIVQKAVLMLYRFALGHPNSRVIFQNHDDRDFFLNTKLVRPQQAVLIRGSGVDLAQYTPHPEPETPVVKVVMVSRFLSDKGIREFAGAARIMKSRGLPVTCVLVGYADNGNRACVSEAEIASWQAEGIIENWGRIDDMNDVYKKAHIACLPSYREGLPKSLLEAGACGRPIVTTDVPGCREVVEREKNGLLVPVRNAEALAEAITRLVLDKELRLAMGQYARSKTEREFAIGSVVDATLAAYRGLTH